jgi:hypothetical protein
MLCKHCFPWIDTKLIVIFVVMNILHIRFKTRKKYKKNNQLSIQILIVIRLTINRSYIGLHKTLKISAQN